MAFEAWRWLITMIIIVIIDYLWHPMSKEPGALTKT